LSCFVPTLFFGNAWIAATLVPPSAIISAMQATTIAGDGRRWINRFIAFLLRVEIPGRIAAVVPRTTTIHAEIEGGGAAPGRYARARAVRPAAVSE
jgi:hypothetical protein